MATWTKLDIALGAIGVLIVAAVWGGWTIHRQQTKIDQLEQRPIANPNLVPAGTVLAATYRNGQWQCPPTWTPEPFVSGYVTALDGPLEGHVISRELCIANTQ